ncbi:MAG TPA: hypothetical protein VNT55_25345 [Baekduia sp.]|nr:hypothetical protein [Baekduia sp.]
MYGAFGSWGWPKADEREAFETEYADTYLPLVHAVPHVARVDLLQADDSGVESDVYRIGIMWFQDESHYEKASATPEWSAMFACCDSLLERYGITLRFAYVRDGAARPAEVPSRA